MISADKEAAKKLAKTFSSYKDLIGKEYLSLFRFLKSDLSTWYNSLTITCFTVGAIALTFGADSTVKKSILYPKYFWDGVFLLLLNGILIFWFKKLDIEREFSGLPKLRNSEADYWTAQKILEEISKGNLDRANEYEDLKLKFTKDYKKGNADWSIFRWAKNIFMGSMTDITFGLLIFPLMLMASQFIDVENISFQTYKHTLLVLLIVYLLYTTLSAKRSVNDIKKNQNADRRIEGEILKDGK